MEWKNQLSKTPYLVLFVVLFSISIGTASAIVTITLAGDVHVTGNAMVDGDLICPGCVDSSDIANSSIEQVDLAPSVFDSLPPSYVPFGKVLGTNQLCDDIGGGSTTTYLHLDSQNGKPFIVTGIFARLGSANTVDDSIEISKIRANGVSLFIDSGDITGSSTGLFNFDVLGQPYPTGVNSPHQLASQGVGVDHIRVEFICDAGDSQPISFIFNTMVSGWMEPGDNIVFTTSPAT